MAIHPLPTILSQETTSKRQLREGSEKMHSLMPENDGGNRESRAGFEVPSISSLTKLTLLTDPQVHHVNKPS